MLLFGDGCKVTPLELDTNKPLFGSITSFKIKLTHSLLIPPVSNPYSPSKDIDNGYSTNVIGSYKVKSPKEEFHGSYLLHMI